MQRLKRTQRQWVEKALLSGKAITHADLIKACGGKLAGEPAHIFTGWQGINRNPGLSIGNMSASGALLLISLPRALRRAARTN